MTAGPHETLKKSEGMLGLILQGSSIPTLVIDKNHVITHCNKAYERFKGIPADKMIGTKNQWMTFLFQAQAGHGGFHRGSGPGKGDPEVFRKTGQTISRSARGLRRGTFFPELGENGQWLFFTAAPLKDKEGNLVGAVETFQDVTQRRRAEEALRESERRFRTLLDFVPYPIGVFTMEGVPTYLNPGFTEVFGWTLQELEGKKIPFVPEEAKGETIENLKRLYKEKILVRHESKRLTKDGRVLDMSIRAAVYSESAQGPSGVISDLPGYHPGQAHRPHQRGHAQPQPRPPEIPRSRKPSRLREQRGQKAHRAPRAAWSSSWTRQNRSSSSIGAAYDATDMQKRVKEVRFSMDELMAGQSCENRPNRSSFPI
jgi:PAS domain S-box-containing protein